MNVKLQKGFTFIAILLVPLFLCLNIWQSYRYQQLEQQILALHKQQQDLLEKNKRAMAAVAVFSSPSRVGALAEENSRLSSIDPEDVILLKKEFND